MGIAPRITCSILTLRPVVWLGRLKRFIAGVGGQDPQQGVFNFPRRSFRFKTHCACFAVDSGCVFDGFQPDGGRTEIFGVRSTVGKHAYGDGGTSGHPSITFQFLVRRMNVSKTNPITAFLLWLAAALVFIAVPFFGMDLGKALGWALILFFLAALSDPIGRWLVVIFGLSGR